MSQQNPFYNLFQTPYQTVPFDLIKNDHFLPAIKQGIIHARIEINAIKKCLDPPSFEKAFFESVYMRAYIDIITISAQGYLSLQTHPIANIQL